jgi:hypothetical protein
VEGTKDMDEEQLADKVIDKLYDKLSSASAVVTEAEDLGELLYGNN